MTASTLHFLYVLSAAHPATRRLPPPFTYTLTDVRVRVLEGYACVDVILHRLGGKSTAIKSRCFAAGEYDVVADADHSMYRNPDREVGGYSHMTMNYKIRGSDYVELDFRVRAPTNVEMRPWASTDPLIPWYGRTPPEPESVVVSGWLERERQ